MSPGTPWRLAGWKLCPRPASLLVFYMVTLAAGLLSLRSPQEPIGDPYFSLLEVLILLLMPFMVALMVAVHAWAPAGARVFSLTAVAFMQK